MKPLLFCLTALTVATLSSVSAAYSQAGLPVPRYGNCPTRTSTQGGSCVPSQNTIVYWNNHGSCPVGWTSSKGYCVR